MEGLLEMMIRKKHFKDFLVFCLTCIMSMFSCDTGNFFGEGISNWVVFMFAGNCDQKWPFHGFVTPFLLILYAP